MEDSKLTIKEIRTACKMTQKEFAKTLEIPKRTIENWELGSKENQKKGSRAPLDYIVKLVEFRMAEYMKK